MKNDIAIKLTKISKRYYLHSEKPTLVENLNPFNKPQEFWALRGINLTIKKGERIGIIGPNGSGKTTLLKIISGLTRSTTGTVNTQGKIVSLIELSAGFHPEMSGMDNIQLGGLLLGISKKRMSVIKTKIIDIVEIGPFIYQPLYTYSSGMVLRLGLSLLLFSQADIFILDETLSVGDHQYMAKIRQSFSQLIKNKKITLIFASHQENLLKIFTNQIVELNQGRITKRIRYETFNLQPAHFEFLAQKLKKDCVIDISSTGSSMAPTLEPNTKITIKYIPLSNIVVGDIVAYYSHYKREIVAHRITKIKSHQSHLILLSQGDNNFFTDDEPITIKNYLGLVTNPAP